MKKLELIGGVGFQILAKDVRDFLAKSGGDDVQIDISSLGGNLDEGLLIYELLQAYTGKTLANIIGLTASAGTVIAHGCDEIQMSDNALFLIHNGWTDVTGNVYDFQKAASQLMKTDAIMVRIYRNKTGLDDNTIKDLMKKEDWLTADEAFQYGFIDKIITSGVKVAADVSGMKEILLNKLEKKMNIFKKKSEVINILALRDGKNLVINAEEAATGVEVSPTAGMTLEDGQYELADGRKISVAGGVITEVMEDTTEPEASAGTEAVIAAVATLLADERTAIMAEIDKKLSGIQSQHTPPKGTKVTGSKAKVVTPRAAAEKSVQEKLEAKREEIINARKA